MGQYITQFNQAEKLNLPAMVRDSLLMPRVSSLLGFSEYIVPNRIPRWLAHPTLRFAHLVQTALICDQLGIRASRVPFGGGALLDAAFKINVPEQSVYEYASYVIAGALGSNTSSYFERNPAQLLSLLKFRETSEGEVLRREIADRLKTTEGAEFSAAIEGGLARVIPIAVVEAARNKFSMLMKSENPGRIVNAIWADANTGDPSLSLWRDRSRELLLIEARRRGVKSESPCLCGSGDALKDCCLRPLK